MQFYNVDDECFTEVRKGKKRYREDSSSGEEELEPRRKTMQMQDETNEDSDIDEIKQVNTKAIVLIQICIILNFTSTRVWNILY